MIPVDKSHNVVGFVDTTGSRYALGMVRVTDEYVETTDGRSLIRVPVATGKEREEILSRLPETPGRKGSIREVWDDGEGVLIPAAYFKRVLQSLPKNKVRKRLEYALLSFGDNEVVASMTDGEVSQDLGSRLGEGRWPQTTGEVILEAVDEPTISWTVDPRQLRKFLDYVKGQGTQLEPKIEFRLRLPSNPLSLSQTNQAVGVCYKPEGSDHEVTGAMMPCVVEDPRPSMEDALAYRNQLAMQLCKLDEAIAKRWELSDIDPDRIMEVATPLEARRSMLLG